jgi:hypothetical protein
MYKSLSVAFLKAIVWGHRIGGMLIFEYLSPVPSDLDFVGRFFFPLAGLQLIQLRRINLSSFQKVFSEMTGNAT